MREVCTGQAPGAMLSALVICLSGSRPGSGCGEEAEATVEHAFSTPYNQISLILGIGLAAVWLRLLYTGARELCEQAAITVDGYLRPRPDPAFERELRQAFDELDAELAAVLGERTGTRSRPRA
jgi:hypothetical protein